MENSAVVLWRLLAVLDGLVLGTGFQQLLLISRGCFDYRDLLASFMHKNRVVIENLGNFSLKILGILYLCRLIA